MKSLFAVLTTLLLSQAAYSDTVKSRFPELVVRCDGGAVTTCTYDFNEKVAFGFGEFSFLIRGVGKPHAVVSILRYNHKGEYENNLHMGSGCMAVSRLIRVGDSAIQDNVFVSTRTGKTYLDHKQCSED